MAYYAFIAALLETSKQKVRDNYVRLEALSKDQNLSNDARSAAVFGMNLVHAFASIPKKHRESVVQFTKEEGEEYI